MSMEIWLKSVLMNLKMDMLHTYPACKEIFYTILKMNRILGNILGNILETFSETFSETYLAGISAGVQGKAIAELL